MIQIKSRKTKQNMRMSKAMMTLGMLFLSWGLKKNEKRRGHF